MLCEYYSEETVEKRQKTQIIVINAILLKENYVSI